jgi:2-polyprenyl-3-methyl-5-hydroxy-6-metoxy-1,4-benzoquinol methylase
VSRYETEIDLNHANNSQTMLITMAGHDRTVLDVGCAAGDTARALVARGCTVSGVEIDADAAEPTRDLYEDLVIANIEESPLSTHFKPESFDAIIFGDVLEHLLRPDAALRDAIPLLAPEGRILVSIPNVAHASVRLSLLHGSWEYRDKGLLDETHLRFYTRESVCRLLEDAGLVIEELRSTVLDPFHQVAIEDVGIDPRRLPPGVIEWVRHQPEALNFQYVASARVLRDGETRPPRPRLQPARPFDQARFRDEHTEQMEALRQERHRVLTLRDHVIGQEAALATAVARSSQSADRAKFAERRARRTREKLTALTAAVERIASSPRPRRAARRALEELRRSDDS